MQPIINTPKIIRILMTKYFYTLAVITFISCNHKHNTSLEMRFTSRNQDSIREINSFYLTSLTQANKSISFKNVECVSPNLFIFKNLENGLYIGMLTVQNKGRICDISMDSISITNGVNVITKEVNIGTVQLP